MNAIRLKVRRPFLMGFLVSATLLLVACANKAKMIQVGASQFEIESLCAIEKIDELRRKETEAKPLQREEASEFFVKAVKNSTGSINLETLRLLISPLTTEMPKSEVQWQAFLEKLRKQYTTFSATFASLDKGSLFARSNIEETIPILEKLIALMAAMAKSIVENPAEFIREKAAVAAELEKVRDSRPFNEITDLKLLELERTLREIVAREEKITRETMHQAVKAARLGVELRELIVNYGKLSVNDIAEGLSVAFKLSADIPGLDLSGLKAQTDDLIKEIEADPSLSSLFESALSRISEARVGPK